MLFVIGTLLVMLALAMLPPLVLDVVDARPDWQAFGVSAAMCMFVGVALILSSRQQTLNLTGRQTFVLTTASWVTIAFFASLPFHFSEMHLSETDAFFEAMSGLTTTGSTILTDLDAAPRGILLWRSLLEWLGGVGIIVMGIAILPFLRVGGMQLFHSESSDRSDKVVPRLSDLAVAIGMVYVGLTMACFGILLLCGMTMFDALNHAMTTLSTGGFSTEDASVGHYGSAAIEWTITVFMIAGALPFVRYISFLKGNYVSFWRDSQVRVFVTFLVGVWVVFGLWLMVATGLGPHAALRAAAFNTTSVVTTTGFASTDYVAWGPLAVAVFFVLTIAGGCTGSTSGGVKTFRFQVLWMALRLQLTRLYSPRQVVILEYNGKTVHYDEILSVLSFIFVFGMTLLMVAILLGALGLDLETAVSGAATALANVGPGLGPTIGPAGNFAPLPDAAKWVLSAAMLLGRLEFFTVIVMFSPGFWRD